ncbi:UNVERIFIED_CONTAM: hypothetical protein [Bacteriophage sp.]
MSNNSKGAVYLVSPAPRGINPYGLFTALAGFTSFASHRSISCLRGHYFVRGKAAIPFSFGGNYYRRVLRLRLCFLYMFISCELSPG